MAPEALISPPAPTAPGPGSGTRVLGQLPNSLALIAAKVVSMGLGFAFWLLAARTFAPEAVGLAAGAVAGMMLCTQLALLGIGSAVISEFRAWEERLPELVSTAVATVAVAAAAGAGAFLLLAH